MDITEPDAENEFIIECIVHEFEGPSPDHLKNNITRISWGSTLVS